jgi:hypothetical protein
MIHGQQNIKFINTICNKEEFPEECKGWIIMPINKKGVETAAVYHCVNYRQNVIQHPAVKFNSM